MNSDGTTTSTSVSSTPAWLLPYQQSLLTRANALSANPYTPYSGQTVAGLVAPQTSAIGNLQNTANQVSNFDLNTNPLWAAQSQAITDAYKRGTAAQTDAAFSRGGNFGGSAWQEQTGVNQRQLGDTLANAAANLQNNNVNQSLQANQALMGAGQVQQQANQAQLTDQYQRFLQQQQWPYQQLDTLGNAINIAGGGNGIATQTTPRTGK